MSEVKSKHGKKILVIPEGYEVRQDGTVWSVDRTQSVRNRWGSITTRKLRGKMLSTHLCGSGYLSVKLGAGRCRTYMVHRLVASFFIPNPDNLPEVNHINGDKTDNRVENLEWVDRSANMRHAADNGLVGGFYGRQKLIPGRDDEKVREVIASSPTKHQAAKSLGVDYSTLRRYEKRYL